jgi:hypothetical protein
MKNNRMMRGRGSLFPLLVLTVIACNYIEFRRSQNRSPRNYSLGKLCIALLAWVAAIVGLCLVRR